MLPTLVIQIGATFSRAHLFAPNGKRFNLVETQKELTLKDPSLLVEHFKARFAGRFQKTQVISYLQFSSEALTEEQTFEKGAALFSKLGEVLVIDVGSEKVALATGRFGRVSCKKIELGLGVRAEKILHQVKIEDLAALIPYQIDLIDIQNYIGKKTLYPGITPYSLAELSIETALATLILAETKKALATKFFIGEPGCILLTGQVFGAAPSLTWAIFPLLQGWQPQGVAQIFVDPGGFLYPFAGLNDFEGMLNQFKRVGTLINLKHEFQAPEVLGELCLDLGLDEKLKFSIKAGELLRVPFKQGGTGNLEVSLKKGVSISKNTVLKGEIDGGELGIVIDGRGRPIPRVPLSKEGRERVQGWIEALGN